MNKVYELVKDNRLGEAIFYILDSKADQISKSLPIFDGLRQADSEINPGAAAYYLTAALLLLNDLDCACFVYKKFVDKSQSRIIQAIRIVPDLLQCKGVQQVIPIKNSVYSLEPLGGYESIPESIKSLANNVNPFLVKIDNGSVLGISFLPVSPNFETSLDQLVHNPLNPNKILNGEDIGTMPIIVPGAVLSRFDAEDHYDEGVLIGNHENFGHWLYNHLARLALVTPLSDLRNVPLIVGEDLTARQFECLQRFGFKESNVIRLKRGRLAKFKTLWVPSMLFYAHGGYIWWAPRIVDYLREGLKVPGFTGKGTRRIFISRANTRWRRLLNEDAIIKSIRPLGFKIIDPASLSILEQIEIASNAGVIIGTFGAGMNLLLFAPRNAAIIELTYPNMGGMDISPKLCKQIGQKYMVVYGEPMSVVGDELNRDFLVSPDQVQKAVQIALGEFLV